MQVMHMKHSLWSVGHCVMMDIIGFILLLEGFLYLTELDSNFTYYALYHIKMGRG
jgi:hypothetical protein